jgi:hypothetical protein
MKSLTTSKTSFTNHRGPLCRFCHRPMRLDGAAPHEQYPEVEIHVYQCNCGGLVVAAVAGGKSQLN